MIYRGEKVDGPVDGVAMVFQSFALFPWLTVLANVELGLRAKGVSEAGGAPARLAGHRHHRPRRLRERLSRRKSPAACASASASPARWWWPPAYLLMDEPFSALDVLTAETLRTDLLDLWVEGRMPIKSILMVTHNIEEAVLMCDRIIVLSSNPGRIAAEIKVGLQHPRNRLDPEFRQLVDQIYALMTRRADMAKASPGAFPGLGMGMALPTVSTNTLAGMIEEVAAPPYDGKADLPALADSLQLEIDDLFPVAETLQLLRFAELAEGDIRLTPAGKRFAEMDVDQRKKLFGDHLLSYVPLAQRIRRVLDERPSHHAPATRFREELEDYMSEDYAETTLKSVTTWGRYGEIFAYDESTQSFNLENPQ